RDGGVVVVPEPRVRRVAPRAGEVAATEADEPRPPAQGRSLALPCRTEHLGDHERVGHAADARQGPMTTRFVIYGAGAIGGTIGGRLFQHGHDVVLLARGAHGDALRTDGLTLRTADHEVT